jgi:hypothetical protein
MGREQRTVSREQECNRRFHKRFLGNTLVACRTSRV